MLFRFTGQYTNGNSGVVIHGVRFEGYTPVTIDDEAAGARLKTHPEVEIVEQAEETPPDTKKRGRPAKAAK